MVLNVRLVNSLSGRMAPTCSLAASFLSVVPVSYYSARIISVLPATVREIRKTTKQQVKFNWSWTSFLTVNSLRRRKRAFGRSLATLTPRKELTGTIASTRNSIVPSALTNRRLRKQPLGMSLLLKVWSLSVLAKSCSNYFKKWWIESRNKISENLCRIVWAEYPALLETFTRKSLKGSENLCTLIGKPACLSGRAASGTERSTLST